MAKRSFDGPDTLEEQSEGEGAVQKVKNAVSDTAEKAQQKAEQVGRVVQEKVASLARDTADKVEATAQYVRKHDVQDMMADLENLVRRHPGQSLVAAAAVGFLLGRAFTSDD